MKDFRVVYTPSVLDVKSCDIATATVIEEGDMVALVSGLIIKAVAASAAIGVAVEACASGDTKILVTSDTRIVFEGTADANFAVAMKGTEVDLVGTTNQLIDVGASTTDVFKIDYSDQAGTVGSTDNVKVRINKPL